MTPWIVAHQAPLSMEFSRQEYSGGLPFPSPEDLPDPGMEPASPTPQANSLLPEPPGEPHTGGGWTLIQYDWRPNKRGHLGDFTGNPVARTPCSQCRGPGLDPWSEN